MIPSFVLSFLFLSIFISMTFSISYSSINFAVFFWIGLMVFSLYYLVSELIPKKIKKLTALLYNFFERNLFKIRLTEGQLVLSFILISVLFGLSKSYYLGGDDTRLFYLYSREYLNNFASTVSPGNTVSAMIGYLPNRIVYYFAVFLTLLRILLPFLNLQTALYTLNILFGLYFFYKFINYIIPPKVKYSKWIYLVCAFSYVFSIFNIYILYNARLISIFLISIFPFSLYIFLKAVRENKTYYVVLISIIWSVFAIVSAASLWFLASLIVVLPLLPILIKDNKTRAIKLLVILGILLFFINLHWLYLLPYSTIVNKSGISTNNVTSEVFLKESSQGLRSNAEINEVFYPLNNLFHLQIQDNFKWPYLVIFEKWYLKLIPFSSVIILLIVMAGMFRTRDELGKLHKILLLCLLLAIYFFTINLGNTSLGNWGIELFVYLTQKVPGFVAFRNMYDKFAYVLSFTFSLSLAVSLVIIFRKISELNQRRLLVCLSCIAILIALPFLSGKFRNLPVWKTSNSFHTTTNLNSDYLDMMDFIKNTNDNGRYLTLPLSRGNIAFIQDENLLNHYYVGVSPQLILSGKDDYSGSISFGVFEKEFTEYLLKGDYQNLGKLFQMTNVKYVITNNTISPDLQNSYLLGDGLYALQGHKFQEEILGIKIKDFGGRYSIYKINPKWENSKIFLLEENNNLTDELEYNRVGDVEYRLKLGDKGFGRLVLLEPFMSGWDLYQADGKTKIDAKNIKYTNWANSWTLQNEGTDELRVMFTPAKYLKIFSIISNATMLLAIGYVAYFGLLKKK